MAEADAGRPVVLVVDDDEQLADMYAGHLEASFDVVTAYTGEDALEAVDDTVDVVLLDRRMPGLSGDEVLEEIRDRGCECAVAMLTAVSLDFDAVEMEFDEYLVKPVTLPELEATVSRMATLASGEIGPKRYYALVSKKAAFEMRKAASELRENDAYQDLLSEIEAVRDELEGDVANRLEAEAAAAVFGSRGDPTTEGPDLESVIAEAESSVATEPSPSDDGASSGRDRVLARGESKALFDYVSEPIFVVNADREFVDCNDAFTARFGYGLDELRNEHATMLSVEDDDEDGVGSDVDASGSTDTMVLQTKAGDLLRCRLEVAELTDESGQFLGRAAVITWLEEVAAEPTSTEGSSDGTGSTNP